MRRKAIGASGEQWGHNSSEEGKSKGDNKRSKVVTGTKSINFLSENTGECLMAYVSLAEFPKWTINSVIFQGTKTQKTIAPPATKGSVVVGSPDDRGQLRWGVKLS